MPYRYSSDFVLADSLGVELFVKLPQDGGTPDGLDSFHLLEYKDRKMRRQDLLDLRFSNFNLVEELCAKFIPDSYAKFLQYADEENLPRGKSYRIHVIITPKRPISSPESQDIQDLLSISHKLNEKRWRRRWNLNARPEKNITDLRDHAFQRLPVELLSRSDTLVVVELPVRGAEYTRSQMIYIACSADGEVFEYTELHPGNIVSAIPWHPQSEVEDLLRNANEGQICPPGREDDHNESMQHYDILVITRKDGRFVPVLYENTTFTYNPFPEGLLEALEKL